MTDLYEIKTALHNNEGMNPDVRDDIFELVVVFNNKFPNVSLERLKEHLKTLKIQKVNKFLNNDVSMYDCKNNILYFNKDKMTDEYDFRHILMYELINIISSNGFQTGFNSEGRFEALNTGYTEILANFLVGNSGSKLIYPNEAVMANMIGVMAGEDKLFDAYFNNDAKVLLQALTEVGVEL